MVPRITTGSRNPTSTGSGAGRRHRPAAQPRERLRLDPGQPPAPHVPAPLPALQPLEGREHEREGEQAKRELRRRGPVLHANHAW